jgi:hypothetical protein
MNRWRSAVAAADLGEEGAEKAKTKGKWGTDAMFSLAQTVTTYTIAIARPESVTST